MTPQPQRYYSEPSDLDRFEAQVDVWVKEAGLRRGPDYDFLVIHHPRQVGEDWRGITNFENGFVVINGDTAYIPQVLAHEMGHALGLAHAHAVMAKDSFGTPDDPDEDIEYGNIHDGMGDPIDKMDVHFGVNFKWLLGWLKTGELVEVTRSGIYRVYAHDQAAVAGRLVGIRVPSKNPKYAYWFEYRSRFPNLRSGALVLFEGFRSKPDNGIHMLDMIPGTATVPVDELMDVTLKPGKSFMDKYGDASFKVVLINDGTQSDAWVDIAVTLPGTTPADAGTDTLAEPGPGDAGAQRMDAGHDDAGHDDGASARDVAAATDTVMVDGATITSDARPGSPGSEGTGDARGPVVDAGTPPSGSQRGHGCSCAVGGEDRSSAATWFVLLGTAVLLRRSRRRPGQGCSERMATDSPRSSAKLGRRLGRGRLRD